MSQRHWDIETKKVRLKNDVHDKNSKVRSLELQTLSREVSEVQSALEEVKRENEAVKREQTNEM